MAEEDDVPSADVSPAATAAAAAIALGYPGTLDPRAAAYLEKQGRLSDKQSALADLR